MRQQDAPEVMLFRLPTWISGWRDSSKTRIGTGFLVLALMLIVITVGTATLVVQQLNARDLKRIEQVGQLQLLQSSKQLELLSNRYSMLLAGFAQDDNFIAQAALAMSSGGSIAPALKRLLIANPTLNHVLWLNAKGRVNDSLRRINGQLEWMDQDHMSDVRQIQGLKDLLALQAKEVWFSDFLALPSLPHTPEEPLIYGAVLVADAQGKTLGYLLLGVDVLRFSRTFTELNTDRQLPQVALLDSQGRYLGKDDASQTDLQELKQRHSQMWQDMPSQAQGQGGQGLAWRHMLWGGQQAGKFKVVRNNPLILLTSMSSQAVNQMLLGNAQLVTGIWGSGLVLLLAAVALLYRRSHSIERYRQREAAIRRIVGLGYWRLNPDNLHLELSGVFHKTLSIQGNPQELWHAWLETFHSEEDRQALLSAIQQTRSSGQGFELEVLMHNRRNGDKGWGLITGTLSQEHPTRGWIEGSVQHITRRKQAELDAQAFRSHLRNIVDWSRLGVWEFDLVGGERRINRYLRDMLGLDTPMTGDYIVFNWAPISHPDDVPAAAQARLDYIAGKTKYYSAKLRVKHTQGHWVWFVLEGENVEFDAQGQPTLIRGTAIDVSELQQAREQAEIANQAKTRFLSRMSHELRTPLNAIMGYTQLLNLSTHLDAQERDHVNAVLAGSRHLLNLINDLLQITRDEMQTLTLNLQPVNLSELSLRCITLMQPLVIEKQLTLQNRISSQHGVMADSLRAQQCIINILANAIKYSEAHTTITLEVSTPQAGMVRLSIRDQGLGIAPEVGNQVFEPFYRSQDTLSGVEGAGIGLAVSQRLAQQMQGHISYASALGVGSVFHLDLPAAPSPVSTEAIKIRAQETMAATNHESHA